MESGFRWFSVLVTGALRDHTVRGASDLLKVGTGYANKWIGMQHLDQCAERLVKWVYFTPNYDPGNRKLIIVAQLRCQVPPVRPRRPEARASAILVVWPGAADLRGGLVVQLLEVGESLRSCEGLPTVTRGETVVY
jgi:hypothetical protein